MSNYKTYGPTHQGILSLCLLLSPFSFLIFMFFRLMEGYLSREEATAILQEQLYASTSVGIIPFLLRFNSKAKGVSLSYIWTNANGSYEVAHTRIACTKEEGKVVYVQQGCDENGGNPTKKESYSFLADLILDLKSVTHVCVMEPTAQQALKPQFILLGTFQQLNAAKVQANVNQVARVRERDYKLLKKPSSSELEQKYNALLQKYNLLCEALQGLESLPPEILLLLLDETEDLHVASGMDWDLDLPWCLVQFLLKWPSELSKVICIKYLKMSACKLCWLLLGLLSTAILITRP